MQKIVPHLWFDTTKDIHEATKLYTSLFADSDIKSTVRITDTPSGDCDIVAFQLAGRDFRSISAGPYFKLNPAISLFVAFDNEKDIDDVWNKLVQDGSVLMPYDKYPWAQKYGWLQDKFGLSWQMSLSEHHDWKQKITPSLLFTQRMAGKAQEAIDMYVGLFPDSKVDIVVPYTKGDGDKEGYIKYSQFSLAGHMFMAMDSSLKHEFTFNEAVSLIVNCNDQAEIDYYWEKLSAVPEAEQCGWLKDKFGVSWQVVPERMNQMMEQGTPEQIARVTQAFLPMKKFDVKVLEKAFAG